MSRSGEIVLPFGEEERTFRLGIGQWRKVQELCDAGPAEILQRLAPMFEASRRGVPFRDMLLAGALGRWRIDDIRAPILHGLVGGGMTAEVAGKLVRELVDERPLGESLAVAYQVVMASFIGADDEEAAPPGELQGEAAPPRSPAASSATAEAASTR